jgi:peptide/nickel transport system permease protein
MTLDANILNRLAVGYRKWRADLRPGLREARHSIRLLLRNPLAVTGLIVFLLLVLVALFAPWLALYDPYDIAPRDRFLFMSLEHPFGTDDLGRDIYSRVIWGSRITLRIGFLVVFTITLIGVPLGAMAGYFGGWVDTVIMRVGDLFLAFPRLVLALALAAALGGGITNTIIAIAVPGWPWYARTIRGVTMQIRQEQYVEAAKASGTKTWRIITEHVIPNSIGPWLVQATMDMGWAIMTAAMLGFLGIGATPPEPEWGLMVATGRNYFLDYWWVSTFPALAIFVVVLGYNLLGDGLRDVIDPRVRRK